MKGGGAPDRTNSSKAPKGPASTHRWHCRRAMQAAAALALAVLLLALAPTHQLGALGGDNQMQAWTGRGGGSATTAQCNAAGKLLLTPTKVQLSGHDLYYESPPRPSGLLLILHKCGRSGSDHWPRSPACGECLGLPQSLAKTKQALSRGYAVAALSSLDRRTGSGGRCFTWKDDAEAAAEAVRMLPGMLRLPPGAPVYVDGTSSGGSLALRLPSIVAVNGLVGEVIAPLGMAEMLDKMQQQGRAPMPPALYIHMPLDGNMAAKVAGNTAALHARRVPVAEIEVDPRPLYPSFFSDLSPAISPRLSAALHTRLKQLRLVDGKGFIAEDPGSKAWNTFRGLVNSPSRLGQLLASMKAVQKEQNAALIQAHVWECIGVAWARHETVGEHMAAALAWLESKGQSEVGRLVERYRPGRLSALAVNTTGNQWRPAVTAPPAAKRQPSLPACSGF